jgi:hypothetical protein
MPYDQMKELAERIASGGTFKKSEVVAFMKEFLGLEAPEAPAQDLLPAVPDLPIELPIEAPKLPAAARLPTLWFDIEKTDSGIHVPREANRSYTKAEGAALIAKLAKALE